MLTAFPENAETPTFKPIIYQMNLIQPLSARHYLGKLRLRGCLLKILCNVILNIQIFLRDNGILTSFPANFAPQRFICSLQWASPVTGLSNCEGQKSLQQIYSSHCFQQFKLLQYKQRSREPEQLCSVTSIGSTSSSFLSYSFYRLSIIIIRCKIIFNIIFRLLN